MSTHCSHLGTIKTVEPSARGCEECLKTGSPWLHLRICRTCGHVGCCDQSPNRHATAHFHSTGHPIIEGYERQVLSEALRPTKANGGGRASANGKGILASIAGPDRLRPEATLVC
jgi:Zn-finger in ubiquitin-hydrolases and other protein